MAAVLAGLLLPRRWPSWVVLAVCGVLMTLVLHLAWGARFPLSLYWSKAWQSIGTLNFFSPEGALIYILGFGVPFGLYWFGWRFGLRRPADELVEESGASPAGRARRWLAVIGFAAAMNAVLLPMYPSDAADVYDYIVRGRMTAYHSLNPLRDVPREVEADPFYRFAAWRDVPSAYGGAWEILAAAVVRVAGNDNITNVIAFKLVAILGAALTSLFIGLTLRRLAPRRALTGVYLFAWNPLVVYMAAGRAHNDTLMTACIALSIYLLSRRWFVGATLAALLGALIKFIPILLIPFIGIAALRGLDWRARARYVALSAILGAALVGICYGPFWFGLETLRAERRAGMYTGSVATIIRQTLAPSMDGKSGETWTQDTPNVNGLLSTVTLGLFALFYLTQLWCVWRDSSPLSMARATAVMLLFYLLVAALWFQSWYVIWPLALVALLDDAPLRRFVLWFSYLVTWQTLLYNYVTLRPGQLAPLPWRDLVPIAGYMLPAWALVGWYWGAFLLRRAARTAEAAELGAQIREARTQAGLSAVALAEDLGMATDEITGCERGEQIMTWDKVTRIRARLALSPRRHPNPSHPPT